MTRIDLAPTSPMSQFGNERSSLFHAQSTSPPPRPDLAPTSEVVAQADLAPLGSAATPQPIGASSNTKGPSPRPDLAPRRLPAPRPSESEEEPS